MPTADTFWRNVDGSGGPDSCWLWVARRDPRGYGVTWFEGRNWFAHRRGWMLAQGPIPAGVKVLHKCDNPPCCNPAHLFLGTQLDNIRDRNAKDRQVRGSRVNTARLIEPDVQLIRLRLAAGESQSAVARTYGVRHAVIWNIAKGHTWASVPLGPVPEVS